MRDDPTRPLTATIEIDAPPADVWAVVADVRRTGEWSPECRHVRPLGTVRPGAYLLGHNRRGWVHWATLSKVTEHQPDTALGWTVLTNRAQWRYELRPTATGTSVVQTRRTPHGESRLALWFAQAFLNGPAGHDDELEAGMAESLRRIKSIVEQPARAR